MGEYTLDSITAMHVSSRSYGKTSNKMKPSASIMTIFDTFVQAFVPLEAEKEEQAIKDRFYRGEEDIELVNITTLVSPKQYGKGYQFLQKMVYQGQGALNNNRHALVEPLSHTEGQQPKDTIGLGFEVEDNLPRFNRDTPMTSDFETDKSSLLLLKRQIVASYL